MSIAARHAAYATVQADLAAARDEVERLRRDMARKDAALEALCSQVEANPTGWGGPMVVSFARSVRAVLGGETR